MSESDMVVLSNSKVFEVIEYEKDCDNSMRIQFIWK